MKLKMLALALLLIPVACNSKREAGEQASNAGKRQAESNQKRDPCSLVTKEEMSQVTGEQFISATSEKNSNDCIYMAADASVASADITSSWDPEDSRAMLPATKVAADLTKTILPDGEQMVSGLGDEASFAAYALTVRKGDAAFIIRLNLPSRFSQGMLQEGQKGSRKYADDLLAMDKALAVKALTRL